MAKLIAVNEQLAKQLNYHRKKMGGEYQLATYGRVIEEALKDSGMWRKPKKSGKKKNAWSGGLNNETNIKRGDKIY